MSYNLGFMYTCFNEKEAVNYSINSLKKFYPDSKICLFSEGGDIWKFLLEEYSDIQIFVEKDTMSEIIRAATSENFLEEEIQNKIKCSAYATLERVNRSIDICNSDYLVMMDPDALVRGHLNIPTGVKLLGSKINTHMPEKVKEVLSKVEGAKVINSWGATPGIFDCETFKKAYKNALEREDIMNDLFNSFYAMYAHDFLIPIIFAMIGEEETFNDDIVECQRDPHWRTNGKPLVHQFKEYY